MELKVLDIKVLKYINRCTESKPALNNKIKRRYKGASISLKILYKSGYIACPEYSDSCQFGFDAEDKWNITEKGAYFLANYKEEKKLTSRQRLFNYFLGFGSGLLSGAAVQLFIRLL